MFEGGGTLSCTQGGGWVQVLKTNWRGIKVTPPLGCVADGCGPAARDARYIRIRADDGRGREVPGLRSGKSRVD